MSKTIVDFGLQTPSQPFFSESRIRDRQGSNERRAEQRRERKKEKTSGAAFVTALLSPSSFSVPTTQRQEISFTIISSQSFFNAPYPAFLSCPEIYQHGIFKEVSVYRQREKLINEGAGEHKTSLKTQLTR